MKSTALPDRVPAEFQRFFWDVKFKTLSPRVRPLFVVNRLLDKGNLAAVRWVVRVFPKEYIVRTIKTVRDFSPRSARFWAHYFGIPHEEVACLQASYLTMRRAHWPF